ncbi:DUF3090 domain-containing protein [Propionibacterium sp. NM47_B9-13]|jgi:uncharacterized repeat protein (TIGR03847 family)|uniref:DUF3090 domain-containing protein n=2 Tax=Cutibacterium modestum TaxID=2559073 RepID=A0AAD1NVP1_9ACTN|nr:DUF3090 domain-containing protein [Cutibacterium modestum]TGY28022.1 DUF3090 domain-containing protein [Propionibacterium sp. NM47_B9-13]AOH46410.1 hypothetical protein BCB70_11390 [Cutibacterium modestum]EFS74288.1 hypothetical protein HMPREF9621_01320 [Cutibacterium modestum HL037PA2]EFS91916.1 hypothetical protein HMPREF9607_01890 [Cutibacterium modestum HL044PA1]EFT16182.1 hypothetical protein HMPREF9622_00744 [Cutibacterium modestum HL037PA3]
MTRRTFRLERPERVVVGTVGQPGARVFHLQVREGLQLVTVRCEKVQINQLALQMDRILDGLATHVADVFVPPSVDNPDDLNPLDAPLEEEFTVGTMAMAFDDETKRIEVEMYAVSDDELMIDDPAMLLTTLPEAAPDSLEILMTTSQARQFVARCRVVVASGRQYCPYCSHQILSAKGHLCPRSNGYRRPLV